jgi:uncharacterized protein
MARGDVEVVRSAYEAWNRGDLEAAAELLSPDIEWRLPANLPDPETWRGSEEVREGLARFLGSWEDLQVDVQELIDAGERVVALVRFRGRAALTGLALEGAAVDAQIWTLRDGKAVRVEMYGGTEEALEAVGRRP